MPKALAIDWKAVERDFVSGKTRSFIASQYGLSLNTLSSKARRCKWVARKDANIVQLKQKVDREIVQTATDKQARYLSRIANQVDHSLDVLESQMPSDRKELKDHIDVLEKVDRIARPTLGLASQNQGSNGKTIVNLAVLRADEPAAPKPVIDIS
jgi:gas vesicle protein